jgi:hypothetical protein
MIVSKWLTILLPVHDRNAVKIQIKFRRHTAKLKGAAYILQG